MGAAGSARPATYGSGQGTRVVPALAELYASEGLPALGAPPAAEQRAIAQAGVQRFVTSLQTRRRIPRRQKSLAEGT